MLSGMKSGVTVEKVTISIPKRLFDWGEEERRKQNASRSEFVSALYAEKRKQQEYEERVERYRIAYALCPSTPEEDALVAEGTALLFSEDE